MPLNVVFSVFSAFFLIGGYLYLNVKVDYYKEKIQNVENERDKFKNSLDSQNKKIEVLESTKKDYDEAINNLSDTLIKQKQNFDKIIEDLKKDKPADTCNEAMKYLKEKIGVLEW
jgi:chromosome segregation ATPase